MTNSTPLTGSKTPIFSNVAYDKLKWVALVFLPAAGLLYFALAQVWGFPYAAQVMASITALDTFLGALLGISNHRYNTSDARFDGALVIDTREPGTDRVSFDMKHPITSFEKADTITLKVETPPAEKSQ
jgi:hypothetical protein